MVLERETTDGKRPLHLTRQEGSLGFVEMDSKGISLFWQRIKTPHGYAGLTPLHYACGAKVFPG
jgi:hypothetical protein